MLSSVVAMVGDSRRPLFRGAFAIASFTVWGQAPVQEYVEYMKRFASWVAEVLAVRFCMTMFAFVCSYWANRKLTWSWLSWTIWLRTLRACQTFDRGWSPPCGG